MQETLEIHKEYIKDPSAGRVGGGVGNVVMNETKDYVRRVGEKREGGNKGKDRQCMQLNKRKEKPRKKNRNNQSLQHNSFAYSKSSQDNNNKRPIGE